MTDTAAAPPRRRRLGRRIGLAILALVGAAAIFGGVFVAVQLPQPATQLADPPRGDLIVDGVDGEWRIGEFAIPEDTTDGFVEVDSFSPAIPRMQGAVRWGDRHFVSQSDRMRPCT